MIPEDDEDDDDFECGHVDDDSEGDGDEVFFPGPDEWTLSPPAPFQPLF